MKLITLSNCRLRGSQMTSKFRYVSTNETLSYIEYPGFDFKYEEGHDPNSKARLGLLTTPHGSIETPNFIFCGTKAAVKAVPISNVQEEGTQVILSNTYHLMLDPGADLIARMGGLHKFMGWSGPILTDSGGYQIFSMGCGSVSKEIKGSRGLGNDPTLLSLDEEGARFRSYVDGSIHSLTPEGSIHIQRQLGADLILVFDECTPFNVSKEYTQNSMRRSHRWAVRSIEEFHRTHLKRELSISSPPSSSGSGYPIPYPSPFQALYGIVQGGIYQDLRKESCDFVNSQPFFGTAIGGSLGDNPSTMHSIVTQTRSMLRSDRPVHLLGIGGIRDIFHGVRQGIDTFDCVHPTRIGRHGGVLVLAKQWEEDRVYQQEHLLYDEGIVSSMSSSSPSSPSDCNTTQQQDINSSQNHRQQQTQQKQQQDKDQSQSLSAILEAIAYEYIVMSLPTLQQPIQRLIKKYNKESQTYKSKCKEARRLSDYQQSSSSTSSSSLSTSSSTVISLPELPEILKRPLLDQLQELIQEKKNKLLKESKQKKVIREHIDIGSSSLRLDPRPLDSSCSCYTCRHFSRSYLHHLFMSKESLYGTLCTIHNIHFMNQLMKDIRQGISEGDLESVEKKYVHPDLIH